TNWTSQVRTIDREHLELLAVDIPYPASDVSSFSVPGIHNWIAILGQPRLASGKLMKVAQRKPGVISRFSLAANRRKNIAQDWNGKSEADGAIEQQSDLHQKSASCESIRFCHCVPPAVGFAAELTWLEVLGRCVESHATTSETSSCDIGLPGTLLRQSGAPISGRPVITIVRRYWSLTNFS